MPQAMKSGLQPIAFFGLFRIELYEFFASAPFYATRAINLVREMVLEGCEQKRAELSFEPVDTRKRPLFQQMEEKALGQVLGIIRGMPAAASEHIERIPISATQLTQGELSPWRLALRRVHDDRPARGVKARRTLRRWTMLAFHDKSPCFRILAGQISIRNKFLKLWNRIAFVTG
jgi:hypothetical protein